MITQLPHRQLLVLVTCFVISSAGYSQNSDYLYYDGTVWNPLFIDFFQPDDPTTFQEVRLTGTEVVMMYDRDADNFAGGWIYPRAWIFELSYQDSITSELRVSKEDFAEEEAVGLAEKWGKTMGLLPAVLREGVDSINILQGDGAFGGNGFLHSIEITIGSLSEALEANGSLEEVLVHEGTHASLDYLYNEGYVEARDNDSLHISAYSAENPLREDISETYLVYLGLKYRENRISVDEAERIRAAIGHRLAFFDGLNLNEFPLDFSDDTTPVGSDIAERVIPFSLFPNPVSAGEVFVSLTSINQGLVSLRLTDLNGRLLQERQRVTGPTLSIDVAGLPPGTYFVQLTDGKATGVTRLIVR